MNSILIKNGLLLSMTTEKPIIENVDILIVDDIISKIESQISEEFYDKVIDASDKIVMPGFINCHNHAAMALVRGYCDDLRLMEWLKQKIWPVEDRLTGDDIYWGTTLAAAEMIKSGTTTFADMYFFMDEVATAVQDIGMRASLCQGLLFHDGNVERRVRATQDLFSKWRGKAEGRITTMVGPHAPYTCPPDKLRFVMELARELNSPIHIHLAETKEEVDQMFEEYGKSPTKYLADFGLFDEHHVLLAHAVHLSREDIYLLKGMRGGISHNPVSNLKLGCGVMPLPELREMGITIGMGTDGAGSATTLDMFEEMKASAWIQKNRSYDPTTITAYQILQMATIEGAKVLGLDESIGSIAVGKKADINIIDLEKPHLYPRNDICALLAYSANGADVETTIINGRVVMENRFLLTVNEKEVLRKANKSAKRIIC
jgi:5-methylthioadenosine/S-adenosylhomocysteine deaminase